MDSQSLNNSFVRSLTSWGGMGAKTFALPDYLARPAEPLVVMSADHPPPRHKEGGQERWRQVVPVIRAFTNAYVTQELDHLYGDSGDLSMAFDIFDAPEPIMFFLALILVSRENYVTVEVEWNHPLRKSTSFTRISPESRQTLFVRLRRSVGDCRVDFHLHLAGTETRRSEVDPRGYEDFRVDQSLIVQCDEPTTQPRPNDSLKTDMFLQNIGYPVFHYSLADLRDNVFECASRVFRHLAGHEIVTDSP